MMFLFQSWSQTLLIAQGVIFVIALVVALFYSIRMGSTKAWKDRAEERKEAVADLEAEIRRLEKQLVDRRVDSDNSERRREDAERRSNDATQLNFELQGKLRIYERKFGPLPPETSGG